MSSEVLPPIMATTENQVQMTPNAPMPSSSDANVAALHSITPQNTDQSESEIAKKRSTQTVSTLQMRYEVVMWMRAQEEAGVDNIIPKAIKNFPNAFKALYSANRVKARRWWNQRDSKELMKYTKIAAVGGRPRMKALPGRGRKSPAWVAALYSDVMNVVNDLEAKGNALGVKDVRSIAHRIASNNPSKYDPNLFPEKIDNRIIKRFFQMREEERIEALRQRFLQDSNEDSRLVIDPKSKVDAPTPVVVMHEELVSKEHEEETSNPEANNVVSCQNESNVPETNGAPPCDESANDSNLVEANEVASCTEIPNDATGWSSY